MYYYYHLRKLAYSRLGVLTRATNTCITIRGKITSRSMNKETDALCQYVDSNFAGLAVFMPRYLVHKHPRPKRQLIGSVGPLSHGALLILNRPHRAHNPIRSPWQVNEFDFSTQSRCSRDLLGPASRCFGHNLNAENSLGSIEVPSPQYA